MEINNKTPRPDEDIHVGDRFLDYIIVFEVIEFVERGDSKNYDVFKCKVWDNYGSFMNGWDPDSVYNYTRLQLYANERM